jgi:signal transduction histidine kinase
VNDLGDLSIFKKVTDQSLIGFMLFEKDSHRSVYANSMAEQILEVPSESCFTLENLVAENPRPESTAAKYKPFTLDLVQHEGLFQNILVKRLNGTYLLASCGIRKIDTESKSYILLMLQETTLQAKLQREVENKQNQIKLAYEELLQQNQQLKELDLAKNRFIALVTHELRTPAAAVVATAETLKLGLYDTPAEMQSFIGMIYDEGQLLLELINDILDFAKIQAGKMDYFIEEKSLLPLAQKVVEALQKLAKSSNVSLSIESGADPHVCFFDGLRMNQVLTNIISNAIKYNRKGGTVKVKIVGTDDKVRVHVTDTGKGISLENQLRVFNEFETLGKISTHTKGTGLGLPISKKMIEAMGGTISLISEEGVGSDFWIDIPKARVLGNSPHYRSRPDDGTEDLAA